MKIGAIVQARMSSQRFPGKVLYRVGGKPILQYLLERIRRCHSLDTVVVATSVEESDVPIVDFCKEQRVIYYQGSLFDVAGRFKAVLDRFRLDAFVRVTGDSPLLDPKLIDKAVGLFLRDNFDMVTNLLPRTYPKGQSVEVFSAKVFKTTYERMQGRGMLEHVSKYFYENKQSFKIYNFEAERNYEDIQLSVDTAEDMERFSRILSAMKKPHWQYGLGDLLEILKRMSLSTKEA